jgi:uncharacterized Tic20 family protein
MAPSEDERTWGMYAHLSGMLAFSAIPFGGIIGPLAIYLQNKSVRPFAREQAREALNFHITVGIVQFFSLVAFVAAWFGLIFSAALAPKTTPSLAPFGSAFIGIGCYLLAYVWAFVFTLIGTIRASSGAMYRYPLTIRFVRAAP